MRDQKLERVLIGAILSRPENINHLGGLRPDDLDDLTCREALEAMSALMTDGKQISAVAVRQWLGISTEEAPHDFVTTSMVQSENVQDFASVVDAVRTNAARRALDRIGRYAQDAAADPGLAPVPIFGELVQAADDALAALRPQGQTMTKINQAATTFMDSLAGNAPSPRLLTGFADLDALTNGLGIGETTLLAGQTSMGKTALAVALGLRAASTGAGVLYLSQEMNSNQLMARVAARAYYGAREGHIEYRQLLSPNFRSLVSQDQHKDLFYRLRDMVQKMPFMIEEKRGLTLTEIGSRIRMARSELQKTGQELKLVIVDHIGLMQAAGRYKGNRVQEITELSDGLARLFKTENVAGLVLSQLNREVSRRDSNRPRLSDLRDSGALEQDADQVWFVYRAAYDLERRIANGKGSALDRIDLEAAQRQLEIIVAKNRNGAIGDIELFADMSANVVLDKLEAAP